MQQELMFKGRKYLYNHSVQTQLTSEYVPDWTLFHAIRESVQNGVDERTKTGCRFIPFISDSLCYIYDTGRGVAFDDILYLGVSGKRGEEGMVGQHGEGEVVSFLVAARCGVTKTMASQDWLARGRLVEDKGKRILVIDVYQTSSPRVGTAWEYDGGSEYIKVFAEDALNAFSPPEKGRLQRRGASAGQLYTNGMRVNKIERLKFGYNLRATPGRDRAGFVWEHIRDEVAEILSKEAQAYDLVRLAEAMRWGWNTPLEAELDISPSESVLRQTAKELNKYAWVQNDTFVAEAQDCIEQGYIVLRGNMPNWIRSSVKHVTEAASGKRQVYKPLPRALQQVVDIVQEMNLTSETWTCVQVNRFEDPNQLGQADGHQVVISKSAVRAMSFGQFMKLMVHEIAHVDSASADCTRGHARAVENLYQTMVEWAASHSSRYWHAESLFNKYVGR